MKRLTIIFLPLALCAASSDDPGYLSEVYHITEHGGGPVSGIKQTVSIAALDNSVNPERWIVYRDRTDEKSCGTRSVNGSCQRTSVRVLGWIDSDRCPALVPALDALATLRVPSFAGTRDVTGFQASHSTHLTIIGRARSVKSATAPRFGRTTTDHIMIHEQYGIFHTWWDRTDEALAQCWQDAAPIVAGKPATIDISIRGPFHAGRISDATAPHWPGP